MIEIKNLYLKFIREYYALYDISINVEQGECVCLLGQEESGKTSLLRTIAKLEKYEKGEIYIKDIPLSRINFKDDVHLGYVSYMPSYLNKKTVYENFKYVLKQRKVPKDEIEQRINDVLIEYNLEKYKNSKINTLTLFEKHAISIIRLALRPLEVALVDNIFNCLDSDQIEQLVSLIKTVFLDKKVTTLIATESEELAKRFSQTIIKFENGSIVKE